MGLKFSVGLGFSSNCNMNCPFCYSKNKRMELSNLDLKDWFTFFDNNNELIKDVNYGTGENTTSEAWYKLIYYVREKYPLIKQALTTNGSLYKYVSENYEKKNIVLKCIDEVDVSLDYGDEIKHVQSRGNPNAYKWAIETLRFCNENLIPATIVLLGIEQTLEIDNLEKIFEIAKNYNAKVRINLYRPVTEQTLFKAPALDCVVDALDWINANHKILSLSDPLFASVMSDKYTKDDPSGSSSIRIAQDGKIYPSTYLLFDNFVIGDIKTCRLSLMREKNNNNNKPPIPKECIDCELCSRCKGGTIDRRYLWYKTLEERDPYCPKRYGKHVHLRHYKIDDTNFESVHDGYLPTMFFGC